MAKTKTKTKPRQYTCLRCDSSWTPRLAPGVKPVQCPRCHSIFWDKPYERKTKGAHGRVDTRKRQPA